MKNHRCIWPIAAAAVLLSAAMQVQGQVVATSTFTGVTGGAGIDSITQAPNWSVTKDLFGPSFGTVDVVSEELSLTHTDTWGDLVYQADWRWNFGAAAGANAPDNNDVFIVRFDNRVDTLSNNFQYRPAVFMQIVEDNYVDIPNQQSATFRMDDDSTTPSPLDNSLPTNAGIVDYSGWGTDINFDGNFDNIPPVPAGETATVEFVVNRSGSPFAYEGQDIASGNFGLFIKTASGGPLPGNYDGNSVVDDGDYDAWRASFGSSVTPGTSDDGNADGIIDAADYVVWRKFEGTSGGTTVFGGQVFIDSLGTLTTLRMATYSHGWKGAMDNFEVEILADTPGSGGGAGGTAGAVPEPGTALLSAAAVAILAACRRPARVRPV